MTAGTADPTGYRRRLAALGELWGAVKYFHPGLMGRDAWWDETLRRAFDMVTERDSAHRYVAAVRWLLAELGDPATDLLAGPDRKAEPPAEPVTDLGDGVVLLSVSAFRRYSAGPDMYNAFGAVLRRLGGAAGLVLDLRRTGRLFQFGLLRGLVGSLVDTDLVLPATRYRYHSGLPSEATETVVGSESGLLLAQPAVVAAQAANPFLGPATPLTGLPVAIVVSDANEPGYQHALALRAAGRAHLVHAGAAVTTAPGHVLDLYDGVRVRVRTQEFVPAPVVDRRLDNSVTDSSVIEVARELLGVGRPEPVAAQVVQPVPVTDVPRRSTGPLPDRAGRLLAATKLWCAANWFFAHKNLCDRPWADALADAVPAVEAAADDLAYALAVEELARGMCDSHAVTKSRVLMAARGGPATVPILVRLVEGHTVITTVGAEAPDLRVGDILLAVDGEKVAERRKRLGGWQSNSSPRAEAAIVDGLLLAGPFGGAAELEVEGVDGAVRTVRVPRGSVQPGPYRFGLSECEVLPGGVGYLDLTALGLSQTDGAFERVRSCAGLILDLRGTPGSGVRRAASHLTGVPMPYAIDCYPTPTLAGTAQRRVEMAIEPATPGDAYAGQVAVLIDERTISHGEATYLMLAGATGGSMVTFGGQTPGVVGHPTELQLPGRIRVCFSAVDVRGVDGRRVQRVGFTPDVPVATTVAGIRAGRDETLDTAAGWLRDRGVRDV